MYHLSQTRYIHVHVHVYGEENISMMLKLNSSYSYLFTFCVTFAICNPRKYKQDIYIKKKVSL